MSNGYREGFSWATTRIAMDDWSPEARVKAAESRKRNSGVANTGIKKLESANFNPAGTTWHNNEESANNHMKALTEAGHKGHSVEHIGGNTGSKVFHGAPKGYMSGVRKSQRVSG